MTLIKVPLNDIHEQLGAKMVPFAGFSMPLRYSSDIEEHNTVRNQVGVFDVSHMGEFFVRGEKAIDLIQYVSSNDASKLENGKAQYSCLPNEEGGIVDDLLVYKIQEQEYMLVVNAANIEKDWNWIQKFNTDGVEMENASDQICLLAIQGPNAKQTLQKLTSIDLDSIKFYHFVTGKMADVEGVIISATGYTGEPGFELYFDKKYADQIWNKIFEAGESYGIKPIGLGARDTLRLEMGLCLYGNDIDDHTSPIEAGLGWITKFTKDFVNADSLKKQKENGVDKKLVGFVMEDKGIPRKGYEIMDEADQVIGHVTSGAQSPTLKQGIGMGYVAKEYSKPSSEIFISVRKRRLKAKVVKPPMIKK